MALEFATAAHAGLVRKYTDEPYIGHPIAVADIVATVTDDPEVIAAAYLHDVVEDTDVTIDDIELMFGPRVARLVDDVTDVSKPGDGNRATRKAIDRAKLARSTPDGATIKLADLIHNSTSIVGHDPGFAKVYMREKAALLDVLKHGNPTLHARATAIVADYLKE